MKLKLLVLFVALANTLFAQFAAHEVGIGYTFAAPVNTMKQHIRHGNGITMNFYLIPEKNTRFAFGADANLTIYGHDKTTQQYTFDDGSVVPMDIVVDNYFVNLMASGRYFLTEPEGKILKPYATLKAGYSWFRTDLNIYDPDDNDHCEPVEKDLLMKDGTFVVSGGSGFQWDLNSVFKSLRTDAILFDISVNLTMGGKVKYMNTDAPSGNVSEHETAVHAEFINTQTQIIHEHHVGYVYDSFVEMIEIRAGFIFRANK